MTAQLVARAIVALLALGWMMLIGGLGLMLFDRGLRFLLG